MGPNGIHEPEESEAVARRPANELPQRRGMLRAHLQLCLIGTTTKLGRRLPADQRAREKTIRCAL